MVQANADKADYLNSEEAANEQSGRLQRPIIRFSIIHDHCSKGLTLASEHREMTDHCDAYYCSATPAVFKSRLKAGLQRDMLAI